MKKQFKKSYRLGITAGLLTGVFVTLLLAPFFPAYIESMNAPVSFPTLFSTYLLMLAFISVFMGILFVSLINVIPSNSIILKFYIFDIAVSILTSPAFFLVEMPALPFYMYAIQFFISLVLYPLIYSLFYLFIAKKLSGVMRFNRFGFVFIIVGVIFLLLVSLIASIGVDTYKLLSKPEVISGLNQSGMEDEVFDRVNQKRMEVGNEHLVWSYDIHKIARNYSLEITETSMFSLFSVYNKTVADRFKEQGLFFRATGENLHFGPLKNSGDFAESALDKWMSRPAPRANIVDENKKYSHAAVGVSCNRVICVAVMVFSDFNGEKEAKLLTK